MVVTKYIKEGRGFYQFADPDVPFNFEYSTSVEKAKLLTLFLDIYVSSYIVATNKEINM